MDPNGARAVTKTKAEAFTRSYAQAMEMSLSPDALMSECAEAIVSHYGPNFMAFTHGTTNPMTQGGGSSSSSSIRADMVVKHLQRFESAGFGWKVKLKASDVQLYAAGSAQCWLTWEIVDRKDGGEGWEWTNIYAFRLPPDGKGGLAEDGYWEFCVSDNEVDGLTARCPNFWEL